MPLLGRGVVCFPSAHNFYAVFLFRYTKKTKEWVDRDSFAGFQPKHMHT